MLVGDDHRPLLFTRCRPNVKAVGFEGAMDHAGDLDHHRIFRGVIGFVRGGWVCRASHRRQGQTPAAREHRYKLFGKLGFPLLQPLFDPFLHRSHSAFFDGHVAQ